MTQVQINNSDYIYIEKLKQKSERQLKTMLDNVEKNEIKLKAEQTRLKNKLQKEIKKKHFIKDLLMEKWRMAKPELLEAMNEIENGGGTLCTSMEEFDRQMA